MDSRMLYNIIYALAARDGREAVLFDSNYAALAREAFAKSLAGNYFPELWFEFPLKGDPWLDLHALVAREDLNPQMVFDPNTCGGVPDVFAWFAKQDYSARQLALSWDTSSGDTCDPAVQLLRRADNTRLTCDFLVAAQRSDAVAAYEAFEGRLPESWFACYTGVFPKRSTPFLRVECIPDEERQKAYADDPQLLADDLRQVGLADLGSTLVPRCQAFAATPFHLEFQFDVTPEGTAGPTFSASLRFASFSEEGPWEPYDTNGAAGDLMRLVETWGLSDDRWRLIEDTMFSKRVHFGEEEKMLYCLPTFLKLRWRDGEPLDAKFYLIAGLQDCEGEGGATQP